MKIVGGLLLSVFCVGSAFSCEVEPEASVLERTSDDILRNMTPEEHISRIKVLEDAYFELKDQNFELKDQKAEVENNLAIMERMYDEREEEYRQDIEEYRQREEENMQFLRAYQKKNEEMFGKIVEEQPTDESFK